MHGNETDSIQEDITTRTIRFIVKSFVNSRIGIASLKASRFLYSPNGNWFDINHLEIEIPRLGTAFRNYRIVHISDIHIGTWISKIELHEIVDAVNNLKPNLIAITGDFVTYDPENYADDLIQELSRLSPSDKTLAVLGNHDHWTDPFAIRDILSKSNIINLSNDVFTLQRESFRLHIAGVDDYMENCDSLNDVISHLYTDDPAILLAHEPDYADISAPTGRFALQLSGHSHGGQVLLPLLGSLYLPRYARKYPSGLYNVIGMHLYTNRGLGTAELQVRFNCRPEITSFVLN